MDAPLGAAQGDCVQVSLMVLLSTFMFIKHFMYSKATYYNGDSLIHNGLCVS